MNQYKHTHSRLTSNSVISTKHHSIIQNRINKLIITYNESIQTLQMKYEALLNHINKLQEYMNTTSLIEEDNNVIYSNKLSNITNELLSELNNQQTKMQTQLNYLSLHFKQSLLSIIKEQNDICTHENSIITNILNETNINITSIKRSNSKSQNEINNLQSLNNKFKQKIKHLHKKTNDDHHQMEMIINKDKEQIENINKYINDKEQIEHIERLNINNNINKFINETKNSFDKYEF